MERRVKPLTRVRWDAEVLWCFLHFFSSTEGTVALVGRGQPVNAVLQSARLEASGRLCKSGLLSEAITATALSP